MQKVSQDIRVSVDVADDVEIVFGHAGGCFQTFANFDQLNG
jgi:hypothetical protein